MRIDVTALGLRLAVAGFLLTLVVLFLYLAGAAQSFLESTQLLLFRTVRWLSWGGLLVTWLLLVPMTRKKGRRLVSSLVLGLGFGALFSFVLVWGSWIYPDSGIFRW